MRVDWNIATLVAVLVLFTAWNWDALTMSGEVDAAVAQEANEAPALAQMQARAEFIEIAGVKR